MKNKTGRTLGIISLILGILVLVFIGVISLWGDIEATFFDASLIQADRIKHLRCPVVITSNETANVTAQITNINYRPVTIEVRAHVTNGFVTLMNEYVTDVPLEPGETKTVDVPIKPEDAAYGRLIMVRIHQMKELTNPYKNASCGVMVINIPFLTGTQFVILSFVLSTVLITGGLTLWAHHSRPITKQRKGTFISLLVFTALSVAMTIIDLTGAWILGVVISAVWVLMGISMIVQFSSSTNKKQPIIKS